MSTYADLVRVSIFAMKYNDKKQVREERVYLNYTSISLLTIKGIVDLSANSSSVFLFRKSFPVLMHSRLLPTFSSVRSSVSGFMFKYLVHLDLSFVQE